MIRSVLQSEIVTARPGLLDLDSSGAGRQLDDVVVARGEVALVKEALDRLALRAVTVAHSTLVEFQVWKKTSIEILNLDAI